MFEIFRKIQVYKQSPNEEETNENNEKKIKVTELKFVIAKDTKEEDLVGMDTNDKTQLVENDSIEHFEEGFFFTIFRFFNLLIGYQ